MKLGYSRPGDDEIVLEMAHHLADYGFEGLQLKGNQHTNWYDDPDGFRRAYDKHVMGVIAYGSEAARTREAVDFCAVCGIEVISWVAGWKRDSVTHSDAARLLTDVGRYAVEQGVFLSLHNHANNLFESSDDLATLRAAVDPNVVGITYDTAHAALGGIEDVAGEIHRSASHIDTFHIKDLDDGGFCPLGIGRLDFDSIFEAIHAVEFDGWLVVDDESGDMTPLQAMEHAAEFLRRYL
ncbi:MAG: sugar phosphate isomerase/epimerase [Candidatus Poribacteria bacterium]|nr:sugar phosphate isomerase/epimerase [Candidatus Poribacteria bacterium]